MDIFIGLLIGWFLFGTNNNTNEAAQLAVMTPEQRAVHKALVAQKEYTNWLVFKWTVGTVLVVYALILLLAFSGL
jgi:hypothetical protein